MICSTKGIVLKTVKYGETSIIVSIFTEVFGIQSYLVNGVRLQGKGFKGHLFQPSSLLEMVVYHNEQKNLQRIKEVKWSVLYQTILSNVTKNAVAVYMVELLQKCLKQPETNEELFHFCENSFLQLDKAETDVTANFPIFFALQLAPFLGFRLHDNYSEEKNFFDFHEGNFIKNMAVESGSLHVEISELISQLLKITKPEDLFKIKINGKVRSAVLNTIENFYSWHIPEFGSMKSLKVLSQIFG